MASALSRRLITFGLVCGLVVPILYFGSQLASAPYYPDYSFYSRDASTLGSAESAFPELFNVAMITVGLLILFASFGIGSCLRRCGVRWRFVWPVSAALLAGGLASINGGVFPLPDERHTSGVLAHTGVAMFLLPVVLPFGVRTLPQSGGLRMFLWINLAVLIGLFPIVSGLAQRVSVMSGVELPLYQEFLNNGHGVLQRVAAAVVFVPIGIVSWYFLGSRERAASD